MGSPPAVSSPSRTATVLASGSPRRHDLLSLLGLPFQVVPADVEEVPSRGEEGRAFAERSARDKALEVAGRYPDRPVLAAAADMLRTLSGRVHQVHTGAALALRGRCTTLVDTATVRFRRLEERAIAWYVGTGEPLDKAGAYAVQGRGGLFVARVGGSPSTVIGLPLHRLEELYSHLGLNLWDLVE